MNENEEDEFESLLIDPDDDGGFRQAVVEARLNHGSSPLARARATREGVAELPQRWPMGNVDAIAQTALDSASLLADAVRHGSLADRRKAHSAISAVIHTLVEPYDGRVAAQPRVFSLLSDAEERLRRVRSRAPLMAWSDSALRLWTLTGFGISLLASVFVVSGHFLLGAFVLALRIAVSVTTPTPGFASDTRGRAEWSVDWRACVVGQITDAALLSSVSGYLLLHGEIRLGMLTALVPLVSLGSTLLRVAAAQGGVVLGRLYVERVARNGPLVGGLIVAAVATRLGSPEWTMAALLAATAGAASFASVEVVRTLVYSASCREMDRSRGPAEVFAKRVASVVPLVDAVVAVEQRAASDGIALPETG